ncbi:hypothetical protein [Limnohabitans sp.]|uniref:hypothetical protein n=1 Tax=Limnohabitans sp. TaxID=1907725 RepID=UPI00261E2DB5|nr:hypothetical protein [Limnohabitans sp.]
MKKTPAAIGSLSVQELQKPLPSDFTASIPRGSASLRLAVSCELDKLEAEVEHMTAWVSISVPNRPSFTTYRMSNPKVSRASARVADLMALADRIKVAPCPSCGACAIHSVPGVPDIEPTCDQCCLAVELADVEEALILEIAAVRRVLKGTQLDRDEENCTHVLVCVAPHDKNEQRDWYGQQAQEWLAPSIRFEQHIGMMCDPTVDQIRKLKGFCRMDPKTHHCVLPIEESCSINQRRLETLERLVADHKGCARDAAVAIFLNEIEDGSSALATAVRAIAAASASSRQPGEAD